MGRIYQDPKSSLLGSLYFDCKTAKKEEKTYEKFTTGRELQKTRATL